MNLNEVDTNSKKKNNKLSFIKNISSITALMSIIVGLIRLFESSIRSRTNGTFTVDEINNAFFRFYFIAFLIWIIYVVLESFNYYYFQKNKKAYHRTLIIELVVSIIICIVILWLIIRPYFL